MNELFCCMDKSECFDEFNSHNLGLDVVYESS